MVKRLRGATKLIAVLALAAGGISAAAVTSQTAGHAPSHSAAASAPHQSKQDPRVRAALLRYLRETRLGPDGAPVHLINPGKSGSSSSMTRVQGTAAQPGIAQAGNVSLSGYQDSGTAGTFTGASGTWRVPRTHCSKEQQVVVTYVGLDGIANKAAEQVGTLVYCFEGVANYFSWWNVFPHPTVTPSGTIHPGDLVTGTVTRAGTSYTLSLTDATDSTQNFSVTQTCGNCQGSAAQWVVERPWFPDGIVPVAPFSWNVTNAWETSNGVTGGIDAGPNPTKITMMDVTGAYPLDSISDLYRNGSSFSGRFLVSY